MTNDNRDKFCFLAGQYNQRVEFYNVDELCADKIVEINRRIPSIKTSWFGIGGIYRLLIPQVLPSDIDKAIYLDSDIIVNLDIGELWQVELGDKPLAAVPEHKASPVSFRSLIPQNYPVNSRLVEYEDYFNSGVLLMNLDYLRLNEELIMNGIKWNGEHPQCIAGDQDILNYLFSKVYLKLPAKFDMFIAHVRYIKKTQIERIIYHYTHPWLQLDFSDPFNRLWMRFFVKTPWFNEDTIANLYTRFQNLHVGLKYSMVQLSAIMSGKTRAFFLPPQNIDGLKRFFAIRDEEEILTPENQNSLQKLLDAMKNSQGKKVFFIMLPNFPFQVLIQAGFAPGRDFVNALEFLSEAQGVPMNSHEFVKAM